MATINFTPLYGVHSSLPCCSYLLEIDEVCILLDCGWTEEYDVSILAPLLRVISRIDLILISYPDMAHMGALPYIIGSLKCKAPIYGTLPVYRMGQIMLYDAYQAKTKDEDFTLFSLDDIDSVFDSTQFHQLKYSEKLTLKSSGDGIIITPHCAGHLIGGSIWKLVKETEEIVYAVSFNHRSEHVLRKSVLETFNSRPSVLITDATGLYRETQIKLKDRDSRIMALILNTIRNGGNVLIPCDSSGRVLELLRVLDQYWIQQKLRDPIALLHDMSYYVAKAAQAMLEWCSTKITKHFDVGRNNPFQFANIHLLHTMDELEAITSNEEKSKSCVVITSSPTLACGYAKKLFMKWASDPKNTIIFPLLQSEEGTLGHKVVHETKRPLVLDITTSERVPLSKSELVIHEQRKRRRVLQEAEEKAKQDEESAMEKMILGIEGFDEEEGDDDDDDEDDEDEDQDVINPATLGNDVAAKDIKVGFGQFASARYPLFFYQEPKRVEVDAYGETIDPETYMDQFAKARAAKRRKLLGNDGGVQPSSSSTAMDVEEKEEEEKEDVPTKILKQNVSLTVKASIETIDFDGIADGRAIKNCIASIKPRKLIIVGGTTSATTALKEHVTRNVSHCDAIFTPNVMECVDILSDMKVYKLQVKESLYSALTFLKVGESHEVAFVNASMEFPADASVPILTGNSAIVAKNTQKQYHDPLLLSHGNVKLDAVKQTLAREGFQSQFRAGMLVCDDGVLLRRVENNTRIVMEGVLSENYYKIRSCLYDQYTLI